MQKRPVILRYIELGVSMRDNELTSPAVEGAVVVALRLASALHADVARNPHVSLALAHDVTGVVVQTPSVPKLYCGLRIAHKMRDEYRPQRNTILQSHLHRGWLRLVGSLKLQVSFAKEPHERDYILQKRLII